MAQLVRAPPCHGGGRRFESDSGRQERDAMMRRKMRMVAFPDIRRGVSSAGRASALQAEGHRFEPYTPH